MRGMGRLALVAACWALMARPATPLTAEEAAAAATRAAAGALDHTRVDRTDALDDDKKTDGKIGAGGVSGRGGGAGSRDKQLLSVLAARRRRLLRERLADHLTTIATLANKPNRNNATFAQLELRDSNSTVFKRIVLTDNNGPNFRNGTPVIRIETPVNSYREQQSRTTERPVMVSTRAYQESKTRAGFLNNRRRTSTSDLPRYGSAFRKHPSSSDELLEQVEYTKKETVIQQYVPGEGKEENVESVVLDPDEEFQVDESNHGLYLLNYSDTSNTTDKSNGHALSTIIVSNINKSIPLTTESSVKLKNKSEEVNTSEMPTTNVSPKLTTTTTTERVYRSVTEMNNATGNVTGGKTMKPAKVESTTVKENENKTLFISDELYKHFRPLETELPAEDMEPFLYFGQKLNSPLVPGDNLTNAPNLSASTKSVQYLNLSEKKRFPTRMPVTDKTKYLKVHDDEEINEDMDVSVVKNVIEKNKIRTSAKILSPLRHLNPYRKLVPTFVSKLNTTHAISQAPTLDVLKNNTNQSSVTGKVKEETVNRTMYANVRNYTRIPYTTFKRRPVKVNPTTSNSNNNVTQSADTTSTTDKPATLVYTAVVTSVSVTSSMKGQNKTDSVSKNNTETDIKEQTNNTNNMQTHVHALDATPLKNNTTKTENASNVTLVETKIEPQLTFSRPKIRTTTSRNINITTSTPGPPILFSKFLNRTNKVRYKDTLDSIITSDFNKKVSNSSIPKINIRPISIDTRLGFDDFITNSFSEITVTQPPGPVTNTPFVIRYTTYQTSTEEKIENTVSNNEEKSKPYPEDVEIPNFVNIAIAVDYETSPKPKLIITDKNSTVDKNVTGRNKSASIHDTREKNDIVTAASDGVVIEAEKTYTATYVLAGLGFLPVTAIIVFVLRSVFLNKTKDIDTDYEGYFQDSEVKKESQVTPVARPPAPPPVKPDQKWEFPRNKLRLQTLLGQGNFGQVWKAEADDLSGHDGLTRLVAVKTIKESASQKEKQELLHEICIMQKLGTHPNVVTLLACCTEQEPYLLVMEYVMCGKLLTYLRERRSRPDRFGGGSGALAARDLTVFAYCVARGMEYLASKGIVHRDLAARNILVDHNKLCKVADFGMSRANGAGGTAGAGGASGAGGAGCERRRHALPVRWMAPESLLYDLYSHETDVWAYGILLWEIVTLGSTPYASMSGREVLQVVTEGYRLERPAHCSPQLYRTMHACWHADAAQRPTFADIKGQIAALLDNEPTDGHYVDLDSFYQDSSVYSDPSAIINDDAGISIEYERELKPERAKAELPRRSFHKSTTNLHRNLSSGNYDQRNITFTFRDTNFNQIRPNLHVSGINSPRMGGFGIRDMGFNTRENSFTDNVKLSSSSFHREQRESNRDNPVSKGNSFNGNLFQHNRVGSRDAGREGRGFQLKTDGNRNKRVSEFECDI